MAIKGFRFLKRSIEFVWLALVCTVDGLEPFVAQVNSRLAMVKVWVRQMIRSISQTLLTFTRQAQASVSHEWEDLKMGVILLPEMVKAWLRWIIDFGNHCCKTFDVVMDGNPAAFPCLCLCLYISLGSSYIFFRLGFQLENLVILKNHFSTLFVYVSLLYPALSAYRQDYLQMNQLPVMSNVTKGAKRTAALLIIFFFLGGIAHPFFHVIHDVKVERAKRERVYKTLQDFGQSAKEFKEATR